jgi:peptide/nickel transport system substrate-binding protein
MRSHSPLQSRESILGVCLILVLLLTPATSGIAETHRSVGELTTIVEVVPDIDPDYFSLDPALDYTWSGAHILRQVYETLLFFDREDFNEYIPLLATGWSRSTNGLNYTFNIRQGVSFHNGNPLTPSDVAYSFQRGLLQGGQDTPQSLLTEPLLGLDIAEITQLIDSAGSLIGDRVALQAWPTPADLLNACQDVKTAILSDNVNWTITFHLEQPYSPFMDVLSHPVSSIIDQEWAIANGAWDGDCNTWQNYYAVTPATDPLGSIANGTGPFKLDYWYPDDEVSLLRNPSYWRLPSNPMWVGGPSGLAFFSHVLIQEVPDEVDRYNLLTTGLVDAAGEFNTYYPQLDDAVLFQYDDPAGLSPIIVEPDGTLKKYRSVHQQGFDAFFNYEIYTIGPRDYTGSGLMDGNGIPLDFFIDEHVRLAFNHAINYEQLFEDLYNGEALKRRGPIPAGEMGYSATSAIYSYDPGLAATEMAAAWGGEVADHGFSMTLAYNNPIRQVIANRIEADIETLNPSLYKVEVVSLDTADYNADRGNGSLPIYFGGWIPALSHPYNWVVPYLVSVHAKMQHLPGRTTYKAMAEACLASIGSAEESCYSELQETAVEDVIDLFLVQPYTRDYLRAEVRGYYFNPFFYGPYFYALSKGAIPIISVVYLPIMKKQ